MKSAILSFSTISIALGTLGFLSGVVGLFFGQTKTIPFWILIVLCWVFLSILIILFKLVYELTQRTHVSKPFETPISYNEDIGCFLIKANQNFTGQIVVGCYSKNNGYEQLAYVGNVHHVQDSAMQIKIIKDMNVLNQIPRSQHELKNLEIRPVVPIAAISELSEVT